MKCPKCAYVGFEAADRCRHCGYDFSLLPGPQPPYGSGAGASHAAAVIESELPLASSPSADAIDLPLGSAEPRVHSMFVDQPPPARAPLAVRRTTTDRPRPRAGPQLVRSRPILADLDATRPESPSVSVTESAAVPAGSVARGAAALIDGALLGSIDLAVVYLTVRMAGLGLADAASLPRVPLGAFVGGLDLAYLVVCARYGGQTFGKMALDLRVEPTGGGALDLRSALLRAVVSVGGLGLGWLVGAMRDDGRALHDHAAATRVVRVAR
jgi:uncharacterized RDD family membrane protein YckC